MDEYLHILTDPAHTLVEFTFVLIDVLIISWVKGRIVRHFHKDIETHEVAAHHETKEVTA